MGDVRRFVTLSAAGVPTSLADFNRVSPFGSNIYNGVRNPRVAENSTDWTPSAGAGLERTTNFVTNPRAAVDTAGFTNTGLATFERSTLGSGSVPSAAAAMPDEILHAYHGVGDATADRMHTTWTTVSGSTYTVSAWVYLDSLSATSLTFLVTNAAGTTQVSESFTTLDTWTRLDLTFTAATADAHQIRFQQNGAGACDFYATGFLATLGSVTLDYGDGANTGWEWTGTAHASTSRPILGRRIDSDLDGYSYQTDYINGITGTNRDLNIFPLGTGGTGAPRIPVTEGQTLYLSGDFYFHAVPVDVTNVSVRLGITWLNAAGTVITSVDTGVTPALSLGLIRKQISSTAPAGAAWVRIYIQNRFSTSAPSYARVGMRISNLLATISPSPYYEYFDGDVGGAQWEGTPHASRSLFLSNKVQMVRDSFKVSPPAASQVVSRRNRRYGGGLVVSETHDNGSVAFTLYIRGDTEEDCISELRSILAVTQDAARDVFFEWRPDGVSEATFYEVAGPAVWNPNYSWIVFNQQKTLSVDVQFPVLPLARKTPLSFSFTPSIPATSTGNVVNVPGDAPAMADITLSSNSTAKAGVLGWHPTPTMSPLSNSISPLGLISFNHADATVVSEFATFSGDGNFNNNDGVRLSAGALGGSAGAYRPVDPSILEPDDFSNTIALEVWCRYEVASTVVSPKLTAYAAGNFSGGPTINTAEYGYSGKLMVKPSSGTVRRIARLGTITLPVDKVNRRAWFLGVNAAYGVGSSGNFGVDYLFVVPARARAATKTGVTDVTNFPRLFPSIVATFDKTITHNLSGLLAPSGGVAVPHSGMSGSPIEFDPGGTDLFFLLALHCPDDPTSNTNSETSVSFSVPTVVKVWPRVHLL